MENDYNNDEKHQKYWRKITYIGLHKVKMVPRMLFAKILFGLQLQKSLHY